MIDTMRLPDPFNGVDPSSREETLRLVILDHHQLFRDCLASVLAEGRRFDLILVDGGHRFDDVFLDLVYADRLLEPGRVVVIDDLWMPAIRAATSYIERNLGYK